MVRDPRYPVTAGDGPIRSNLGKHCVDDPLIEVHGSVQFAFYKLTQSSPVTFDVRRDAEACRKRPALVAPAKPRTVSCGEAGLPSLTFRSIWVSAGLEQRRLRTTTTVQSIDFTE